jgi:predicted Zn-dependent peptidase
MPQYANTNWYNAHNFYGDLAQLDAATLEDVRGFFKTYYAPNNAVLVVSGDFRPAEAKELIRKYFGAIPKEPLPQNPELSEPRQEAAKRFSKEDPLAHRPALAVAYHMPARNTPEYYAMGMLDQILLQGDDAMLYDALVRRRGMTASVDGGINADLGNMFDYNGPMLWIASLFHDSTVPADSIVAVIDSVIDAVAAAPLDQTTLERARVKFRSQFYDMVRQFYGFGRVNLLASFALFDDDPAKINQIEQRMNDVTPDILQKTAREYLRKTNQTLLTIVPKSGSK